MLWVVVATALVGASPPRTAGFAAVAAPQTAPIEHRLFAGRTFDASIPRPADVLGYELGEAHTDYEGMERYFRRLDELSERLVFDSYGETWERHRLHYAAISAAANLARLDDILDRLGKLADPRRLRDDDEADDIVATTPAVVFLNYGTDGNETAAFEAAIHETYQLVAATDAATRSLLEELVVVITPAMNADSHERYVAWLKAFTVGAEGSAEPDAAEHAPPWGVSTNNNHYQVDVNRDSVWSTQVENRALLALYRRFRPQVFVDHHGEYPGFTGPWMVEPLHRELTANQRAWIAAYGEAMAAVFERHGYRYSPWEFGQFDPGYWDTLPNFTGAVAFTLETTGGGSTALRLGGDGDPLYTLRDGVIQHLLADESVLRLTAARREAKLRDYLEYRRTAIAEGREHPVQAYLLPADNDPERLETVVNLLVRDGVEVLRAGEAFEIGGAEPYFVAGPVGEPGAVGEGDGPGAAAAAGDEPGAAAAAGGEPGAAGAGGERTAGRSAAGGRADLRDPGPGGGRRTPFPAQRRRFPAGTFVVPMAQPEARLLRVLMQPEAAFTEEFLARIRRRDELRRRPGYFYGPGFYDITAWSLPYTYHLEAYRVGTVSEVGLETVADEVRLAGRVVGQGSYALAFGYDSNRAIAGIAALARLGVQLHVGTQPLRAGDIALGRGAVVVYADYNRGRDLEELARLLSEDVGLSVLRFAGALVDEGPHLGSESFVPLRPARLAVVMNEPVRTAAYGSVWFLMERRYGVPFTALDFGRLARAELRDYDVIVLPDGSYPAADGDAARAVEALRRWVGAGGTLVGIGGAAAWLASEEVDLTAVRPAPARDAESGRQARPIPGSILRAEVWPYHWLSFGYETEVPVHVWSDRALVAADGTRVAVRYAPASRLRVSGFADEEDLERLAGTPYLLESRLGAGRLVLFAEDPNFRVTWDGLTRLFFNALLFAKSF